MGSILNGCKRYKEQGLEAERGDTEAVRSSSMSSANVDVLDIKYKAVDEEGEIQDVCEKDEEQGLSQLHLAAERGDTEAVRSLLLSNNVNVNACNNSKMTALHLACRNGHTSIVEILLDNHAIVDVTKQSEETPFYLAAKNGHAEISGLLLRRGVCDFVKTDSIETPLHVAFWKGSTDVVEVILKHNCRIYEKLTIDGKRLQENTKRGVMPVELFKSDDRRVSAEIVWTERNKPLKMKREINYVFILSCYVTGSIDLKMAQLLLSVDQCMFSEKPEKDIASNFRSVIAGIDLPNVGLSDKVSSDVKKYRMNLRTLVQFVISSSYFNVNHQDWYLNTLLHDVIKQRSETSIQLQLINYVIQLLLEKGADFNMKNSYGETPLIVASKNWHCDAIQILFDWEKTSGIKLDLDARDRFGATALIKAAKMHHISVVRLLLSRKVSVNLCDYYGFTALHAGIVFQPNRNWFDLQFFCKGLHEEKFDDVYSLDISSYRYPYGEKTVDPYAVVGQLQNYLEHEEKIARFKEEVVKLLLDYDETNVNAIDFRGNTPLDLAVKSSKRITSGTFEALKNRGAICHSLESEDEAPIEVARVDERGRNPLHRLMISLSSGYTSNYMNIAGAKHELKKRLDLMVYGILLRPEKFRVPATETDDKGRTALHCAVIEKPDDSHLCIVRLLLKLGSNVNAADMYRKTPLHYAEFDDRYKFLVQYGANENTKDKKGHTPRDLKRLRELVEISEDNAKECPIGREGLHAPRDIAQLSNRHLVTELSKRKLIETIRIYSQSPRPQESSEEAIWKIWTKYELDRLNRRLTQLKPLVQHFIERLADGIKEKDWRFQCQPILVGSADEETKAVISADFDFNFKLIKFSQLCHPFPHPLGPKGYFQLKRKPIEDTKSRSDERFACFFNLDQRLLTKEVNSRFQILVERVLKKSNFWQNEHRFEWKLTDKDVEKSREPDALCKTVRLKMIHPIADEEGGFLFVNISIDIVACVHVENWWPEDPLPVYTSPAVKANGCTFVFDRPVNDYFPFSDTCSRISFAPLESRIIRESSLLAKAAFLVCKIILFKRRKTTYQLKTCLLFCMEALNARSENETRNEDEITPKQLAFWVERLMFCFMKFSRYDVFPCYFMPSFKQKVAELSFNSSRSEKDSISYPAVYDIYLDLCPDDTAIDIHNIMNHYEWTEESLCDPKWEQFGREEFIRKLSSRNFY